ncbi:MAG: alpha/beta fold hydrolase [Bacteroidetes bacterium]|nr:alpha/beta fold hydrolase [Bacteroidota bacterium]
MYVVKDKKFASLNEYFDYIVETVGFPPVHTYFKNDTIISDGLKLHVDVYEYDAMAPTLVFIPGTAMYALCYGELLFKIAQQGYNIVALDPRGHGRSEGLRGDYTIDELVRDGQAAVTYATQRFNSKVSVMGSSQGGIVAFYIAAKDKRVNSVICQCFADLTSEDTLQLARHPRVFKYLKLLLVKAGDALPNPQIPITSYIDLEKIPVRYFGTAKAFMDLDPLVLKTISLRALRSLAHTEMAKPVEKINTPVFVLQGTADSIFPITYTQKIYDRLHGMKRFTKFPDRSHALLHEDIDGVLPEITTWLKDVYHLSYQHQLGA